MRKHVNPDPVGKPRKETVPTPAHPIRRPKIPSIWQDATGRGSPRLPKPKRAKP
jgi:hypothetical protein